MTEISQQALVEKIERLNTIGQVLSSEQNFPLLLETILLGAKELTNADGGSLYILADDLLVFELIHTTSLGIHMGGTSEQPVTFPPIPVYDEDGQPNQRMVVTRAVTEKKAFNIPDAYTSTEFDFSGPKDFDARTGYYSKSFLVVPMQDHEGNIIGALQLINAIDRESGEIRPFGVDDESLISSIASQAAIALNRKALIDSLEEFLNSLVRLIAKAIDDKSPHTGGHCRRVPPITMALAMAINEDNGPVFGTASFSGRQLDELELAAWLHDCGKITTPEYVIEKHTRLETIFDRIELVELRLELLRRDLEIARLKAESSGAGEASGVDFQAQQKELDEIANFLRDCNSAGFLDEEKVRRIEALARHEVQLTGSGKTIPLLSEDEKYNLSIRKGTLTNEERDIINSHVEASIRMLQSLPFPKHLRHVPEIAGGHHERIDGKGYPQGVPARDLSLQARILAIADIFEALTASDRVYRKPNTLREALRIMAFMCKEGHIDPDLLRLFISRGVYRDYAASNLKPEQFDEVDAQEILAILD